MKIYHAYFDYIFQLDFAFYYLPQIRLVFRQVAPALTSPFKLTHLLGRGLRLQCYPHCYHYHKWAITIPIGC